MLQQDFINLSEKYCDIDFIKETLSGLESVKKNKERIENGNWEDYFKEKQIQFKQSGMSEEDVSLYTVYANKELLKDISKSEEMYGKLFPNGECVFKTKARQKKDNETGKIKNTKAPELSVIAYSIILDRFYDKFVAFTNDQKLKELVKRLNELFGLTLPDDNWYDASKKMFEILYNSSILSFLADDVRKMAINKIGWRLYCNLADKDRTKGVPYNLILTGAPGTGKTYMAKNILAAELIMGKSKKLTDAIAKDQVGFVQFHPSYDYSDFIEGLRPIQKGTGIVFERKDGVFKEFCKKALANSSKTYVFIIDEINRGEMSKIFGELFFSIDPGYRGTEGRIKTQYANLVEAPNEFDKALGITEIKDTNGNVTNKEDFGHFFVPENVYIIGTMNDIDRSVESMDFAMRRRFAFKEVRATDRESMLDEKITNATIRNEAIKRMRNVNYRIQTISGLNEAYHVGPAYFGKIEGNDFDELWNNHIKGLLNEYLRGMPNAKELLDSLERAYKKTELYVKLNNNGDLELDANKSEDWRNKIINKQ